MHYGGTVVRHGKTGRKLQKENRRYRITVITPCYNEELNVENCQKRLQAVMTTKLPEYEYEHIFADNSSTDDTFTILNNLAKDDPRVKVIRNSRNVGPFRNMWNAMKSASGDVVIPLLPADPAITALCCPVISSRRLIILTMKRKKITLNFQIYHSVF